MSAVETRSDTGSGRARAIGLAAVYGLVVVAGLYAAVAFTIQVHGVFGQYEADPVADIPAIVAVLLPASLGFYLGWRLPAVARTRNRALLVASTALAAVGLASILDHTLTGPELIVFLAAYTLGPPLLGRLLKLAWVTIRGERGRAVPLP